MASIAGRHIKPEIIESFCSHWNIREFSLFGSVLRDDFNDASDVDVTVSFRNDARWSLLDHVAMRDEIVAIFGRKVTSLPVKGLSGVETRCDALQDLNPSSFFMLPRDMASL